MPLQAQGLSSTYSPSYVKIHVVSVDSTHLLSSSGTCCSFDFFSCEVAASSLLLCCVSRRGVARTCKGSHVQPNNPRCPVHRALPRSSIQALHDIIMEGKRPMPENGSARPISEPPRPDASQNEIRTVVWCAANHIQDTVPEIHDRLTQSPQLSCLMSLSLSPNSVFA